MRLVFAALAMTMVAVPAAYAAPAKKAAAPAKADWVHTVVATPEGGMRMGNPAAKVKLIEFGSRTCPHCARFDAEGLPALQKGYIADGKVSYEYRDYPVHGALDLAPILLGHCVPARAFFPLLDLMMMNQQALIGRTDQVPADKQAELQKATPNALATYLGKFYGYTDLVVKHGLPAAKANACRADPKGVAKIVASAQAGDTAYKISSTPTFILNGTVVPNAFDWAALEPAVRTAVAS